MSIDKKQYIEYEDGSRVELDEDDIPELDEAFFRNARPFKEVLPEMYESWKRSGGRPRLENPKQPVKLRLDADVLAAWKATGKGWQTRINQLLREQMPSIDR